MTHLLLGNPGRSKGAPHFLFHQVFAKKADGLRNEAADLVRQGELSQARCKAEEAKKVAALGHKLPVPGRVGVIEKGPCSGRVTVW